MLSIIHPQRSAPPDAVKTEINTLEAELADVRAKMQGYLEELGV